MGWGVGEVLFNQQASRGPEGLACGEQILQHMQVFCSPVGSEGGFGVGGSGERCEGCSQSVLGLTLTFLQLCHHVVVLEEGLAAERVCEQHLDHEKRVGTESEEPIRRESTSD